MSGIDLMAVAEGADAKPTVQRQGSSLDKSKFAMFAGKEDDIPVPQRTSMSGRAPLPSLPKSPKGDSAAKDFAGSQRSASGTFSKPDEEPISPSLRDNPFMRQDSLKAQQRPATGQKRAGAGAPKVSKPPGARTPMSPVLVVALNVMLALAIAAVAGVALEIGQFGSSSSVDSLRQWLAPPPPPPPPTSWWRFGFE